ncbi:hypothetical protein PIB30_019275 [Stylosanthes scabra]|uniref:Uncharacterized protein n=1 Tax=Stylosanthes scabra TaxID=79078 RepID=A0ABU6TA74_9FABA|nr:hypothetical protein [Stylosanthes scabra]
MAYPWFACEVDGMRAARASRSRKPCVNRSSGSKVIATGSWRGQRKNWLEPILQPALAQLSSFDRISLLRDLHEVHDLRYSFNPPKA